MDVKSLFRSRGNGYLMLGEKEVEVPKLNYRKYRQMQEVISTLPGVIFSLIVAPPEHYYQSALTALDMTIDQLYGIVEILSEIDREYLETEVGVNEVLDYLVATVKKNDFAKTVKNVKSLLPETTEGNTQ
ncbi:hypothetical protein [Shouchella patagoniensis]|uniref:hypothetical protein n=1 Tax=Shouchella patagoniensis TaxID=228576 RepID=UPI0009956759|nr:hypothetical protein [Shouchella patagoniensis]